MEFLFLKSVNINIVLSWIIIAILFARVMLRKKVKTSMFFIMGDSLF